MLAGPMDYHLGGFRAVPRDGFEPRDKAPVVLGTRCHHLAMYVVYESYLQLVCDYPSAYEGQPGFEFIKQVPTTWDDIKVINDAVGDYITIARKSGDDWYVGSMTDWTGRTVVIPLDFLQDGEYEADIYSDTEGTDENPNLLKKEIIRVGKTDTLNASLVSGGGHVMYISPVKR